MCDNSAETLTVEQQCRVLAAVDIIWYLSQCGCPTERLRGFESRILGIAAGEGGKSDRAETPDETMN
jgi:hypothetical protein